MHQTTKLRFKTHELEYTQKNLSNQYHENVCKSISEHHLFVLMPSCFNATSKHHQPLIDNKIKIAKSSNVEATWLMDLSCSLKQI
jgi:hypothetical protein